MACMRYRTTGPKTLPWGTSDSIFLQVVVPFFNIITSKGLPVTNCCKVL
jgi:hypothetical protein